jgi:hypothetical protein
MNVTEVTTVQMWNNCFLILFHVWFQNLQKHGLDKAR